MRTYDIRDDQNRVFAFEIDNWRIGRRGVCRVVRSIPGATLVRAPKLLSWFRESIFCEFLVDGEMFEVEEPYGANRRSWVGPRPPRWVPQADKVREAFARA